MIFSQISEGGGAREVWGYLRWPFASGVFVKVLKLEVDLKKRGGGGGSRSFN